MWGKLNKVTRSGTFAVILLLVAHVAAPQSSEAVRITVFAHYVSWHIQSSTGWDEASIIPYRRGPGSGEGYDSVDPNIIREQNADFLKYGITPLSSWWGAGHYAGDDFLDAYLAVPSTVKTAVLYEVTGLLKEEPKNTYDFDNSENVEKFISDVTYLSERYFTKYPERFVHIDGRPVVFIWLSGLFIGDFESVSVRLRQDVDVFIIGSGVGVFGPPGDDRLPIIRGMDAMSAYGSFWPDIAREHHGHFDAHFAAKQAASLVAWSAWLREKSPRTKLIPPLMFAYNDTGVLSRQFNPPMVSTMDEAAYLAGMVRALIMEGYDGCSNILPYTLFVSYNEHYEGSSLEASMRGSSETIRQPYTDDFGYDYLNVILNVFGPPIAQTPRTCSPF